MLNRKGMAFGAMAAATVLSVASAAFACTAYKGTGKVENVDQTNNAGHTIAKGNGSGMGYCSGYPKDDMSTGVARPANAQVGDSITVTVSANSSTDCNTTKLAAGTNLYRVMFVNYERQFVKGRYVDVPGFDKSTSGAYTLRADCMTPNNAGVVTISSQVSGDGGFTFDVDSTGYGTGTYTVPSITTNPNNGGAVRPNTATDASAICISDNGAYTGNQVPLRIVL